MSFWGLVKQKGPWKETRADKRNTSTVNPTLAGGGVPAGGTLHAGHAYWESDSTPYQQNGRMPPPKMSTWAMRSVMVRDQIPPGKVYQPKPKAGVQQTVVVVAGGRPEVLTKGLGANKDIQTTIAQGPSADKGTGPEGVPAEAGESDNGTPGIGSHIAAAVAGAVGAAGLIGYSLYEEHKELSNSNSFSSSTHVIGSGSSRPSSSRRSSLLSDTTAGGTEYHTADGGSERGRLVGPDSLGRDIALFKSRGGKLPQLDMNNPFASGDRMYPSPNSTNYGTASQGDTSHPSPNYPSLPSSAGSMSTANSFHTANSGAKSKGYSFKNPSPASSGPGSSRSSVVGNPYIPTEAPAVTDDLMERYRMLRYDFPEVPEIDHFTDPLDPATRDRLELLRAPFVPVPTTDPNNFYQDGTPNQQQYVQEENQRLGRQIFFPPPQFLHIDTSRSPSLISDMSLERSPNSAQRDEIMFPRTPTTPVDQHMGNPTPTDMYRQAASSGTPGTSSSRKSSLGSIASTQSTKSSKKSSRKSSTASMDVESRRSSNVSMDVDSRRPSIGSNMDVDSRRSSTQAIVRPAAGVRRRNPGLRVNTNVPRVGNTRSEEAADARERQAILTLGTSMQARIPIPRKERQTKTKAKENIKKGSVGKKGSGR